MEINLNDVYKKLLTGELSCNDACEIMKSPNVRSMVNAYINKSNINKLIPYFQEDLQNIYMLMNITQFIYNNSGDDTGLSDSEYDSLYASMIANGGSDIISAPITPNSHNVEYHKYPDLRGTLTKIFYLSQDEKRTNPSRKYLDEWISSMENKIYSNSGRTADLNKEEIYVFPKYDGVSGIFEMDENNNLSRVLTRGYTETNEAQNITKHFKGFHRDYHEFGKKAYGFKTEIMMQESDLEYYNIKYHTDYKNTRSIVSAIINSDEYDEEKASLLHPVPLRVGTEDGEQELAKEAFDEYPYIRCRLQDREIIRKFANEHRYVHDGLRCDGAVIYIINPEIQKILGRENNKNLFEVAYKFTEEVAFSKLIDITFNMGLFGRLAPVAQVKKVKLKGNTIENISLGSIGRFNTLKLCKGDTVKVLYDIIPYLSFDSECSHNGGKLIEIPDNCPECGEKLEFSESGDIAFCNNPNCSCRIKGKILNYLNKMNIDGISYGIIEKLYEYGLVRSIQDIYRIGQNKELICRIDGFGSKSLKLWLHSIDAHRNVDDFMVLGALGIEGLSKKTFAKVLSVFTIEELIDLCENNQMSKLVCIPGIQELSANKIINGINDNLKLIKFLEKELVISSTKGSASKSKFTVCFTKVRNDALEQYIGKHGGKVVDSLTKDTTFLVVPSLTIESSKVNKAKKYGVRIVSIDDFENTLKEYEKEIN